MCGDEIAEMKSELRCLQLYDVLIAIVIVFHDIRGISTYSN